VSDSRGSRWNKQIGRPRRWLAGRRNSMSAALRPISRLTRVSQRGPIFVMAAASVGLVIAVFGLPVLLSPLPAPIGNAAEEFGRGARMTLLLTGLAGSVGLILGLILGLAKVSASATIRAIATAYIWVIRGTPLVVQLLFVYFVLPTMFPMLRASDVLSAVLALGANVAAYNAEILRGALQAVPRGQTEAAYALGLRRAQSLRLVLLPQAIRMAVPPLVNNMISLLKDSSLAYVIGVVELSLIGNRLQAETFRPVPSFVTVAGIYLMMTTFMNIFSHALEKYLSPDRRR
jgi:polar amino acid transport system permease protein